MSDLVKKILIVFTITFIIFGVDYFFISNNTKQYKEDISLLNANLVNQGKTLFDMMVFTRTWNGQNESLYVKNPTLKPNPYLADNIIVTENNVTLIRVNAAWMTKQISAVANQNRDYFYRITSLRPKNPNNKPDSFEAEALHYFDANKEQTYYYKIPNLENKDKYFNFMGSLKVEKECLACHNVKENKIGEIRGGIRVSILSDNYKKNYERLTKSKKHNDTVIITFSLLSLITIIFSVLFFMGHQEKIKNLNASLKKKVTDRTEELHTLNKELELRIEDAVEEVKEKEKLMISQAKSAAMGEMITMIAHQWRQPLSEITMINNNIMAEIMFAETPSKPMKKNIENSFEILEHLSNTIDDFASFFKPTKVKDTFLLNDMFESALKMLSNVLKKNSIQVIVKSTQKIEVYTYQRELLHVILNLINNSKDAYIENDIDINKRVITIEVSQESEKIVIELCDKAGGIKKENMDQIFNPYFSTKSKNGTGLGLYISKVIVEQHLNGKINAYNSDNGVCFVLKLNINED